MEKEAADRPDFKEKMEHQVAVEHRVIKEQKGLLDRADQQELTVAPDCVVYPATLDLKDPRVFQVQSEHQVVKVMEVAMVGLVIQVMKALVVIKDYVESVDHQDLGD